MTGFRLVRADTAFQNGKPGLKKRARTEDRNHLEWIRTLPCIITGKRPVDAAHIRYADPVYGKVETGAGRKPSDSWCLPLHREIHRAQHEAGGERAWWARHGLDPLKLALALHHHSGDDDQAMLVIAEAHRLVATIGRTGP